LTTNKHENLEFPAGPLVSYQFSQLEAAEAGVKAISY